MKKNINREIFNEHYSLGGNQKVLYIREKPFISFCKQRLAISISLGIFVLLCLIGIVLFSIFKRLDNVLVTISLLISSLTLFAAIYISWYQDFVSDSNSFPFITIDIKKIKKEEMSNFMQLDALDDGFYVKANNLSDILNNSKCPSNIIEIKDPNNEIYDVDVFYLLDSKGKCILTKYYVKNDEGQISIGIPTKDLLKDNPNIIFDNDNKGFLCLAYSIKTKIREYNILTFITFKKSKIPGYCLHSDVVTKRFLSSLINIKKAQKFVQKAIQFCSQMLGKKE